MNVTVKGIGCDIVEISRIKKGLETNGFIQKVFTKKEQCRINTCPVESVAGIWAAKESVAKALGTGFTGFTIRDIEIVKCDSGQPMVNLYNGALCKFKEIGASAIHLSISHDTTKAIAFVVIE